LQILIVLIILNSILFSKVAILNEEEKEWLNKDYKVKVRVANWPPFQMYKNGKASGISVDYIIKIFNKYNIKYEFISTDKYTFSQVLNEIKDKRNIDLLLTLNPTEERKKNMLFTLPYLSHPRVIFTRKDYSFVAGIKDLTGKVVSVQDNFEVHKILEKRYPKIKRYLINSKQATKDSLEAVAVGKTDAFIGNLTVGSFIIQENDFNNLKVAAPTELPNHKNAMAVRNDWGELVSIIDKELKTWTTFEKSKIRDKYLTMYDPSKIDLNKVLLIITILIFLFGFIIIVFYFSNKRLSKEIKKRKEIEKNLQDAKAELKKVNTNLEDKIKYEIDKNKKQQLIMMEQSKLAQMGEMIANIAHQWRQPLAQVNSSILIIDTVLESKKFQNEIIEAKMLEIEDLTQYMSNTIDNFQNFFNQDKIKIDFFLREIIDNSISIIKGTLCSNFTQVEINVDKDLKAIGYPMELQQVLVIILSNANDALMIRKIPDPKILIDIKDENNTYIISISDNAGGINIERLERVFEPYYTTKHKSQGRGVGLYMAKMIIEDGMKGKLTLKNNEKGVCFSIQILKEINNE